MQVRDAGPDTLGAEAREISEEQGIGGASLIGSRSIEASSQFLSKRFNCEGVKLNVVDLLG